MNNKVRALAIILLLFAALSVHFTSLQAQDDPDDPALRQALAGGRGGAGDSQDGRTRGRSERRRANLTA